jgi:transketolase
MPTSTAATTPEASPELEQLCINTIRFLAVDAVQKANSGHPGAPMGMAAIAYTLWTKHLRFNPKNPGWANRDRFVLSNGHASMLLYSMLYLTGYDVSIDDLKNFRQLGSKTPGHPELGITPGVEVTTGPLGQGFANGVGLGIAEQFLRSTFNRAGHDILDHRTYVFCGDGCLEEGISSEAASLAGHLELGKLIYFYDSNQITIDGSTRIAFTEDVHQRFEAYRWHVEEVYDGNDVESIDKAIRSAQGVLDRPSIIICHTHIGYGSPNRVDTPKAHGAPLGKEEVALTKQHLHWPLSPEFLVPEEALAIFRIAGKRGEALEKNWNEQFAKFQSAFPDVAAQLTLALSGALADGWDSELPTFDPKDGQVSTRTAGNKVMNAIAAKVPTMIGGSADLVESNFTKLEAYPEFEPSELTGGIYSGRTINFGIREHAMGAIVNGMSAHGGVHPFGATFFTFSDYMRPAVRLAALSNHHSIFVWTHDSVALGEDGPTHQPIEHLASFRAMPNMTLIRPADANETVEAWRHAMRMKGPVGLILTRQKLPVIDQTKYAKSSGLHKGAYVLSEAANGKPEMLLIATGSEVYLALEAQDALAKENIFARVVSMPSFAFFAAQDESYQDEVLPPSLTCRLSIELGASQGWERWVGASGASLAIDHFGASAPIEKILEAFGFTTKNIVALSKSLLKDPKGTQRALRASNRKH